MPYCWKCGAKLKEEDRFCSVCGATASRMIHEEFTVSADNLVESVKQLLHEGNVTRIIVKDDKGKVLLEIPATVGVVGRCSRAVACCLGRDRCLGHKL